jgi:dipeptide/tripeptide permease
MIGAPHIFAFSPVARLIKSISAFTSDRFAGSANVLTNEATLMSVGFVLLAAIASILSRNI